MYPETGNEWNHISKIEEKKQELKLKDKKKHSRPQKERKMRFNMRKKAKRSIDDLKEVLTEIGKLDSSENDYALIFGEDKPYFDMLKACNLAYSESFKSNVKLRQNPDEFLDAIQVYSMKVGLKIHSKRQLSNRRYQNKVLDALKKHPKEYQDFSEYYQKLVSEKPGKIIEELFKKELQHVKDTKSNDLYTENKKNQDALQIAAKVYGKLLEGDKEFLKKSLEQIKDEIETNS